jgi:hypothetical protein
MNEKTDTLKKAISAYNKGKITKEALQSIAKDADRKVTIWDKKTERNIYYPKGDNTSRVGFTFDPKHPKGKLMNKIIKKSIWKVIEFAHKKLLQNYDNEIFVYDDARLGALHDFLYAFIDQHGSHSPPRAKLYKKAVDLFLGIAKEDLRYRALCFHGYNKCHMAFRSFELTPAEKDNIKRWR